MERARAPRQSRDRVRAGGARSAAPARRPHDADRARRLAVAAAGARPVRRSASRPRACSNGCPKRRRCRPTCASPSPPANPALALTRVVAGERPAITVSGDAAFASRHRLADRQPALGPAGRPRAASSATRRRASSAKVGRLVRRRAARRRQGAARSRPRRSAHRRPAALMRHVARLVVICVTVLRYGLDELALSSFRQPWVRLPRSRHHRRPPARRAARRAPAPRPRAARADLRQVRPGAVDAARPAAARHRRRARQAAGPGAAVSGRGRAGDRRAVPSAGRSTRSSRASRPRRWRARRSRRCTSRC